MRDTKFTDQRFVLECTRFRDGLDFCISPELSMLRLVNKGIHCMKYRIRWKNKSFDAMGNLKPITQTAQ